MNESHSSVIGMTVLWSEEPGNCGVIAGVEETFFSSRKCPDWLCAYPASYLVWSEGFDIQRTVHHSYNETNEMH